MDDLYLTSKWLDLLLIVLLSCDSEQSNLPTLFQTLSVVNRPSNYTLTTQRSSSHLTTLGPECCQWNKATRLDNVQKSPNVAYR